MEQRTQNRAFQNLAALVVGFLMAITVAALPMAAQDGAGVFKSKCVTCHGTDGKGTAVGKSLQVADLGSAAVQKKTDAELTQSVSEGKGNMPAFKGNVTDDELHAVITFVRSFAAKGDSKKK